METLTTHTARPSRLRVALADARYYLHKRRDDIAALAVGGALVVILSGLVVLGIVADYNVATGDALAIGALVACIAVLVGVLSFMFGIDKATTNTNAEWQKDYAAMRASWQIASAERDALADENDELAHALAMARK